MNRLYILFFLFSFITFGCKNNETDEQYLNQSINTMNMNIYSKEGKKLLSIKSPYSNYNKDINTVCRETIKGYLNYMELNLSKIFPQRYYFGIPAPFKKETIHNTLHEKRRFLTLFLAILFHTKSHQAK